jgi:hypothetical protein
MPKTHDPTGRSLRASGNLLVAPRTTRPHRRNKISGQFAWKLIEMLESPAYRVLSLSGRKLLSRIEIEHAHHGGTKNGKLPVTFDDFVAYGVHRHSIAPAIREVIALGFAEITQPGRAGNAEYRMPNKFRLTYQPADDAGPTDDWRQIATIEQAEAVALTARKPIKATSVLRPGFETTG